MSYFERSEHTITSKPMQLPYTVSDYRLDWRRALAASVGALGALLVGYLLLALAGALASWSLLAAGAAGAGALVAVSIAGVAVWLQVAEWRDHRAMLWELHSSYLDSIEQHGAQEVTESASQVVLRADSPADVLIAALYVHRLVQSGADAPWTTRALRGPVFVGSKRVASITKPGAEQLSKKLGDLGLIGERYEGSAGRWLPASADEVLERIWRE